MEQTIKRGGARTNAGRKPSGNPKKPLTIYLSQSTIEKHGAKELRELIHQTIKNYDTQASHPVSEQ